MDIQKDFCPGGALAVADSDNVVSPVNALVEHFEKRGLPVFLTRDWHPANHHSFKEFGGPWPRHCVAGTDGAAFHPDLKIPENAVIISKATEPDKEAYSGFEGTDLSNRLKKMDVEHLVIVGLATDYCVKSTVLGGLKNGFSVTVVPEGIRAVNVNPDDGEKAVSEMKKKGATFTTLAKIS